MFSLKRHHLTSLFACVLLLASIAFVRAEDQSELARINAARELNETWSETFDKIGKYPDGHSQAEHHAMLGTLLRILPDSRNYLAARAVSDQFSPRDAKLSRLERAKGPSLPEEVAIELGRLDRSYGLLEGAFTLKNPNQFVVADIKVVCDVTAPSGTVIDQKSFTVFEVIPAKGQQTVRNFKFGTWPEQGKSIRCHTASYSKR